MFRATISDDVISGYASTVSYNKYEGLFSFIWTEGGARIEGAARMDRQWASSGSRDEAICSMGEGDLGGLEVGRGVSQPGVPHLCGNSPYQDKKRINNGVSPHIQKRTSEASLSRSSVSR